MIRASSTKRATPRCTRLPPGLLALLADPLAASVEAADRDHLEACRRCRAELTELALAGHAVRGALATPVEATPQQNTWPLLRRRLERRSPPVPAYGTSVAGMALGVALAIGLVLPLDLRQPVVQDSSVQQPLPAVQARAIRGPDDIAEGRWLRQNLVTRTEVVSTDSGLLKVDPNRYGEDSRADRPTHTSSTLPVAVE